MWILFFGHVNIVTRKRIKVRFKNDWNSKANDFLVLVRRINYSAEDDSALLRHANEIKTKINYSSFYFHATQDILDWKLSVLLKIVASQGFSHELFFLHFLSKLKKSSTKNVWWPSMTTPSKTLQKSLQPARMIHDCSRPTLRITRSYIVQDTAKKMRVTQPMS